MGIFAKEKIFFQQTENEREVWEDGGYYLLFIPLLCCLYFFRRGILVLFFCFILPVNAFAGFFTNNNQDAEKAMAILKFTPKSACEYLEKLLASAMANAENNHNMDVSRLYVAECFVCPGPTLKRIRPKDHGRAHRILKRTSHVTIVLKEREI